MTSVVVLGEPLHGRRIVRTLNRRGPEMDAVYVGSRGYPSLLRGVLPGRRGMRPDVLVRAGFRAGASTARGRLFDRYWALLRRALPDARPCHVWLGTDVLHTRNEMEAGTIRRPALAAVHDDLHLAVAPWLTEELAALDIEAVTALLPPEHPVPDAIPPMPVDLRILTYAPGARFAFYGGPAIIEAARQLPDIPFDVVGAIGKGGGPSDTIPLPANVRRLGWVADMPARYAAATIVVRMPDHDGFGNTVIEGLANARHVVYTHVLPGVRCIPPGDAGALVAVLGAVRDDHLRGRLGPNLAGRSYVLEAFDPDALAGRLVALVGGGAPA